MQSKMQERSVVARSQAMPFQKTEWQAMRLQTARLAFVCAAACCLARSAWAQPAMAPIGLEREPLIETGLESGGAWPTFKGDLQRTSSSAANLSLPLNLLWRHTVDLETFPDSAPGSPLVAGPPDARRVFFTSGNQVFCIDAETGSRLWTSVNLGSSLRAPLSMISGGEGGDTLLAVGNTGIVNALRASDGASIAQADARTPIQNAPILVKTAKGDRIIVPIETGRLIAYTRALELDPSWTVTLGRDSAAPTSSPALNTRGDRMYLTANDQSVYCVNPLTGKLLFGVPLGGQSASTPVLLGDSVAVAAGQSLVAMRQTNGVSQWKANLDELITASPAGRIGANGQSTFYVGTRAGTFYAINGANGRTLWKKNLETPITGTPLVLPNVVLVGTANGIFYGFDPTTGAVSWSYRLHTERDVPIQTRTPGGNRGGNNNGRGGGGGRDGGNTGFGGRGGGGRGGGNNNRRGGRGGIAVAVEQRTFGVSSAPSLAGDQVYLLGDNQALYSFTASGFDSDKPRFLQPTISVTSEEKTIYPRLLSAGRPFSIAGRGPIYFTIEIDDPGSGINPDSLKITRNGTPVAPEDAYFAPATGVLTLTLADIKEDGTSTSLPDGPLAIAILARDYKGNTATYNGTISVDNLTAPPSDPSAAVPAGRNPGGNFPGGNPGGNPGGFPGGGFPGGAPGGFPGGGFPGGGFPGGGNPNGMTMNGFPPGVTPGDMGQGDN